MRSKHTLDSLLDFGKHEGEQVEDIVEDHPDYVRWLIDNGFGRFGAAVIEALEKRERRRI